MSQYGTPTTGETRIKGSRETDVPGVTESLGTPGLANMPVTPTSGLNAFHELSTALGLVGQDAALYAEQQLQERDRQDRFNAHAEQIDHAKALEHAESILPGLASQVADGKVSVWNDKNGESQSSQQAEFWAESIAGSGSDAYSTKLRSALAPHLAKVLEQAREKKLNTAAIETAKDSRTLVYTPLSPDGSEPTNAGTDYVKPTTNADDPPVSTWRGGSVPSNVGELIDSGYSKVQSRLTRDQYIALSVMPAIRMAGKNGDTAAIDELAKHVPDSFANDVENAHLTAARVIAARASQQATAADGYIASAEYAAISGDGSFQTARDRIERSLQAGIITPQDAARRREHIDTKERETLNQNKELLGKVDDAMWEDQIIRGIRESIVNGKSPASIQEKFERLHPDGSIHSKTAKELIPKAIQANFDEIDQNTANKISAINDGDYSDKYKQEKISEAMDQSMQLKNRLLANGYTYEPWQRLWNGAPQLASPENLAQGGPLPADLQNAVALRDRVPNSIFDRHVSKDHAYFWHTLDTVRKDVTGNSPDKLREALALTFAKMGRDPAQEEISHHAIGLDFKAVNAAVDGFAGGTVSNREILMDEAKYMARFYMGTGFNMPPDKALTKAMEDINRSFTNLNGTAVATGGVHVPKDLDKMSGLIAFDFAEKHPELGLAPGQMTLRPYLNDSWIVVKTSDANLPFSVPAKIGDGIYTAADIEKMRPGLLVRITKAAEDRRAAELKKIADVEGRYRTIHRD